MVQQRNHNTMGEDRVSTSVERKNYDVVNPCRHRHSSVISSCSEDAESESTSAGYPSTYDDEREEELEYGPGIVSKLKTRYMSIALKQNRGTNMRRSCSMENLLDQDSSTKVNGVGLTLTVNCIGNGIKKNTVMGNLKRAKSMDTLLSDLHSESHGCVKELVNGDDRRELKVFRRRDGGLNRTIPMICDEELPKPDTVKTYKRMFEPAESRRGSHCRRPPVLRASAKSSALAASKSNGILSSPSAKVNGSSLKSKISAKPSSPVTKAQSNGVALNGVNGVVKKPCTKDFTKLLCNGGHVVKANPIKMVSSLRSNKETEKELNNINRLLNQKEVHFSPKTEIICNGNLNHKEDLKDQNVNSKKEITETMNSKPKIPPNKPTLKPPKPLPKLQVEKNNKDLSPKLKLSPTINGSQKISEPEKNVENNNFKFESKMREEKPLSPKIKQVEESAKLQPEVVVSKLSNGPNFKEINNVVGAVKNSSQIRDASKSDSKVATPVKKTVSMKDDKAKNLKEDKAKPKIVDTPIVKLEPKPIKKPTPAPSSTCMVFDFRGKDVVPHVAILPTPFGCKSVHPKKRPILIDGKETTNGNGVTSEDEDEDYIDYSVPLPCGLIFEGENVKIGKGSILSIRNKDLKITFVDDVDSNTFIYPSESSLLEDCERSPASTSNDIIPNDQPPPPPTPPKLKSNTVIGINPGSVGGLSTYTPSVLRTMDNFEPGMFRPPPPSLPEAKEEENNRIEKDEEEEENQKEEEKEMLKPADPDIISSWSLSAGTSDLLF